MEDFKATLAKLEKPANQIKDLLDAGTIDTLVDSIEKDHEELKQKYDEYNKGFTEQEKRVERLRVQLENVWEESDKQDSLFLKMEELLKATGANIQKLKDLRR